MIEARLLVEYAGMSPGLMGVVVGRLQPSGPVWVRWNGRKHETLMRRSEIELILPRGIDSVYVDEDVYWD